MYSVSSGSGRSASRPPTSFTLARWCVPIITRTPRPHGIPPWRVSYDQRPRQTSLPRTQSFNAGTASRLPNGMDVGRCQVIGHVALPSWLLAFVYTLRRNQRKKKPRVGLRIVLSGVNANGTSRTDSTRKRKPIGIRL